MIKDCQRNPHPNNSSNWGKTGIIIGQGSDVDQMDDVSSVMRWALGASGGCAGPTQNLVDSHGQSSRHVWVLVIQGQD